MFTEQRKALIFYFLAILLPIGIPVGIGGFAFVYGKGYAYLTNDAKACASCHIMNDQYNRWRMGDHHAFAQCNDCHAPKDIAGKLWTKATNGFWHSVAFTSGRFTDPIQIKAHNKRIAENSCKNCHSSMIEISHFPGSSLGPTSCLHCHANVGHGKK